MYQAHMLGKWPQEAAPMPMASGGQGEGAPPAAMGWQEVRACPAPCIAYRGVQNAINTLHRLFANGAVGCTCLTAGCAWGQGAAPGPTAPVTVDVVCGSWRAHFDIKRKGSTA